MASIVVAGDTSGTVTLTAPATAGTTTLTLPTANGTVITTGSTGGVSQSMLSSNVVGNGPAFSGYISGYQGGISQSTFTKANLNAEYYDTNNNFNTSNGRFTPTVAGYYQINAVVSLGSAGGTYPSGGQVQIYKNGSGVWSNQIASPSNQILSCSCSGLVYMNGSTDYLELYGYMTGGSNGAYNGDGGTVLSGVLVRAA